MTKTQQQSLIIELGKRLAESTINQDTNVDRELAREYLTEYKILKDWIRVRLYLPDVANPKLTPRQRVAVELAGKGLSDRLIAREMKISRGTVKIFLRQARQIIK